MSQRLYGFAWATEARYHRLDFCTVLFFFFTDICFFSFDGWKSKVKVSAGLVSSFLDFKTSALLPPLYK